MLENAELSESAAIYEAFNTHIYNNAQSIPLAPLIINLIKKIGLKNYIKEMLIQDNGEWHAYPDY